MGDRRQTAEHPFGAGVRRPQAFARVDLINDRVGLGVDDRDLVRVILRHVELRLRGVEGQSLAVAVEPDALDQAVCGRGGDVDDDFTVAV
jgi:hypothetical protein